jgi:hypothetical protein
MHHAGDLEKRLAIDITWNRDAKKLQHCWSDVHD